MIFRKPASAILLFRMSSWIFAVTVLLRFLSLPRVMQIVRAEFRAPLESSTSETVQRQLGQQIDMLLGQQFLSLTTTCWKRAIVLYRFLGLAGIESRVIFGVRKRADGSLEGHAWLERDGLPILETTPPAYSVTFSFPAQEP